MPELRSRGARHKERSSPGNKPSPIAAAVDPAQTRSPRRAQNRNPNRRKPTTAAAFADTVPSPLPKAFVRTRAAAAKAAALAFQPAVGNEAAERYPSPNPNPNPSPIPISNPNGEANFTLNPNPVPSPNPPQTRALGRNKQVRHHESPSEPCRPATEALAEKDQQSKKEKMDEESAGKSAERAVGGEDETNTAPLPERVWFSLPSP